MNPVLSGLRTWIRSAPMIVLIATVCACGSEKSAALPKPSANEAIKSPIKADPADWCKGHGVPESKCTKCNPELIGQFQKAGDWCAEHGFPESVCPVCKPSTEPAARTSAFEAGTRIRFKSQEIERAAGIEVTKVRAVELGEGIACVGQVDFDRNHFADIRSTTAGIVRRVLVNPGDPVRRGQVLFELESLQVGDAQGRVRTAEEQYETIRARHDRVDQLRAGDMLSTEEWESSLRELRAAETELSSSRSALRIVGASASIGDGRFALRSPIDGQVVRRDAVLGTLATEDTSLAAVADSTSLWVILSVGESDAPRLSVGAPTVIRSDATAGLKGDGVLAWLSPQVDSRSRMVEGRVEMKNPGGAFRAGQFVQAVVQTDRPQSAAAVPREAVQRMGSENVVFVRVEPNVYEPRSVRTGKSDGRFVHVEGPVDHDDEVVTVGAFLLKTEISKESIGAGCCEIEEKG